MKPNLTKPIKEYTDDQLFSLMYNPIKTDKKTIQEVFEELQKRGYHEKAEQIENDLIKLKPLYASFWNRLGAFIIDIVILGFGGTLIGLVFRDFFVQLGQHGVLAGFFISWAYFGLLNSNLTGGQTPGKMALKIRVTDADGNSVQPVKSLLRALVYIFPLFLINYSFGLPQGSFPDILRALLLGVLLIGIPVHMLMNKPVFQAVYDILAGTYVIRTEAYQRREYSASPMRRIWIAGGIALVVVITGFFINSPWQRSGFNESVRESRSLQKKIKTIESVSQANVSRGRSTIWQSGVEGKRKNEFLTVSIWTTDNQGFFVFSGKDFENESMVQQVVMKVLNEYPDVDQLNQIRVNVVYGYNIGIARFSSSVNLIKSPEEWREILHN